MLNDAAQSPPLPPGSFFSRDRLRSLFQRSRLPWLLIGLLSLLPVGYVLGQAISASRNVVYWDEFETALALMLKLKEGTSPGEFLSDLFALNNEHRMVTSRLMFATSYWLTGTVNFSVISLVGNASIVALCVMLVLTAGTAARRLVLGVLLAALLFQLEHYENFLWSGSSIDHFQVVLLAGAAIVGLARQTKRGLLLGALLAAVATFTLAHGIMVWPVGAMTLLRRESRRRLVIWCACGAVTMGFFLTGFHVNQAHNFAAFSASGALEVLLYWLAMLGAAPTFGHELLAPVLGGILLAGLGLLARRGVFHREPIAFPLTLFAIAAAALIAVGRAEQANGLVHSRYYVLSGLAWALTLFMAAEYYSNPLRPLRLLTAAIPLLVAFNLTANRLFAAKADSWVECRDRAVTSYKQNGIDGQGTFTLHPTPARSTDLLNRAEALGVYRMGPVCLSRPFITGAQLSNRMAYFVDEMTVNERSAFVRGWAAIPGERSKRGEIHVVLRSEKETFMYTAVTITRPDVAKATGHPEWELAGFRFVRRRDRLPTGEFQLGFLITNAGTEEYIMTAHRLRLIGEGEALLATGQ